MIGSLLERLVALVLALIAPVLTLSSVQKIDDYPLYVMHVYGDARQNVALFERLGLAAALSPAETPHASPGSQLESRLESEPGWACSLFAALAEPTSALYGRSFDWEFSPAALVFHHPPDGYDSVAMVDIAYLGYASPEAARRIDTLSLAERAPLLEAVFWPFDGMNEHGLAVGMAAVPASVMPYDSARPTIDSLGIIREVLDHARTVDEAIVIFGQFNINMGGGPPLHYLVADAAGDSALIEFEDGAMVVLRSALPWDMATNFLRVRQPDDPESACSRYRAISDRLEAGAGRLTPAAALALLQDVAQPNTQWSIVYGMATGEIRIVMGRQFETVHVLAGPRMAKE